MKSFKFSILGVILVCLLGLVPQVRADAPVQVALVPPVQLVDSEDDVKGVRLNVVTGLNENVSGVDIGLFNRVEGDQRGLQMGIYNSSFESTGLQFGLINHTVFLDGLQIGLLNFHEEGDRSFFPVINFAF